MSEMPGRDDTPEDARPPYPGWSPQQPPSPTPPGQQAPGQQAPGQQPPGWQRPGEPTGPAGPGGSGPYDPGGGPNQPQGGWHTPGAWAWRPPDAKPGVIPLRPLGVGEILDGAVTTIRKNLGAMLGLAAVVATIGELVNLAITWAFLGEFVTTDFFNTSSTLTPDEAVDLLTTTLTATVITVAVMLLTTVFLTGMLTVVVGRAVLGEYLTVGQTWQLAKGRMLRLLGLLIVYTLLWASGFIAAGLIGLAAGVSSSTTGFGLFVLGLVAAVPLGIWLYVRFALSTPSLMLETTDHGNGLPRPVTIIESLRRSGNLVRNAWWRTFGILLLVMVIVYLVSTVIAVPFSLPMAFGDGLDSPSFVDFAVASLGNILITTITAPFAAAATALVYIDRRIRREGLDLELARAAGVDLPGRYGDNPR